MVKKRMNFFRERLNIESSANNSHRCNTSDDIFIFTQIFAKCLELKFENSWEKTELKKTIQHLSYVL